VEDAQVWVVVGLMESGPKSPEISVADVRNAFEPVGVQVPARASSSFLIRAALEAASATDAELRFVEQVNTVPLVQLFTLRNVTVRPADAGVSHSDAWPAAERRRSRH
jgi:hypothetical protein